MNTPDFFVRANDDLDQKANDYQLSEEIYKQKNEELKENNLLQALGNDDWIAEKPKTYDDVL